MNPNDRNSRPLELTRPIWIALAVVALLGVVRWWDAGDRASVLMEYSDFRPVIARHQGTVHQFPLLGITVTLPEGWTYLAVTQDAVATQATLVHPSSHSIVSFRQNRLDTWPPKGHPLEERAYTNVHVQWIGLKVQRLIPMADSDGEVHTRSRYQLDHRRLGRLMHPNAEVQAGADVIMIVMSHLRDTQLNDAIEGLCDSIEFHQPLSRATSSESSLSRMESSKHRRMVGRHWQRIDYQ